MDEKLYDQKFRELQKYVPFLDNLIKGNHASNRTTQLDKMRELHRIITDTRKKKLDTLLKCESAVKSIYEKFQTKVCSTTVNVELVKREAVKEEPNILESNIENTPESPPPIRKREDCLPVVIPTERSQVRSAVRASNKNRDRSRDRSRDSRERKFDRRRDRSNSRHRERSSNKRNPFVKERDGSRPSHSPIRTLPSDRSDRHREDRSSHKHSYRSDRSHERSAIDAERSSRSTDRSRSGGPQNAAAIIRNIKLERSESSPDVGPIRKQNHESVFERLGNKTDPKPFENLKIKSTDRSRSVAGQPYVDKTLEPLNDAEVKELNDDNAARFGKQTQLFQHMDKNMKELLAMRESLELEMRPLQEVMNMNKKIEGLKAENSRSNSPASNSGSSNSPAHISGIINDRNAANKVENQFYASFRQLEANTIDEKPKSTVGNSDVQPKGKTTLLERLGINKQHFKVEKPKPSVTEILKLHSKTSNHSKTPNHWKISNMYSNPSPPPVSPPPEPLPSFPSPSPPRSTSPPRSPEPFSSEVSAPVEIFNNDDRLYDMLKQAVSTCERQKADEDQTLPIAMKAVKAIFGNEKRTEPTEQTQPVRLAYKYNPRPRKRTEDEPPLGVCPQISIDSNPNEPFNPITSVYKRCGSSFDPRTAPTATINTYDAFMANRSGPNTQQRNNTYDLFNADSPMGMSSPTENSSALLPTPVNSLPCNMYGPPIDPRLRNRDPRVQSVEHNSFSQPSNTSGIFAQAHQTLPQQNNVGIFAQAHQTLPSHTSGTGMHMNLTRPNIISIFPSTQQSFLNNSCTSPTYQPLCATRNILLPTPNLGRSPNYHNSQSPYTSQHVSPSYDTSINLQNKFHSTINDNVERQKYELSKKNKSHNNNTQHQSYGATSERPAGMTYGEYKRTQKPAREASREKPSVSETATSTSSTPALTTNSQLNNFIRDGNRKAINKFKIPKLKKNYSIPATVVQDSEVGGSTDHENNTSEAAQKFADDLELIEDVPETICLSDDDDIAHESVEPDTATPVVELLMPATNSDPDSIQVNKKWLDSYLQDFLNPANANRQVLLSALSRTIDEDKYLQILKIIESPAAIAAAVTADGDAADSIDSEMQPIPEHIEMPADDELPIDIGKGPVVVAKKKRLNELQKLNEDIRTMFISNGVLTATGRRFCTTVQRPDVLKPCTPTPPVTPIPKAKATPANKGKAKTLMSTTDESDSSIFPAASKRITRRRCSIKSLVETKSDDEDDTNDSDNAEPSPPKVFKKKAVPVKTKEPEVPEINIPQRITRRRNTLAAPMPLTNAIKTGKLAKVSNKSKAQSDEDGSTAKTKQKAPKSMPNLKPDKATKSKPDATEKSSDDETNATDDEEYHRRPMRVRPQDGSPTLNLKIVLEKVDAVQTRKRKSNDTISLAVSSKKAKISNSSAVVFPPNTNIKMFPQHKDFKNRCVICEYETARSLVLHYVNEHRDAEVYVSRLASDIAAQLMNPRNKLKKAIVDKRKDEMRFRQLCYFCKKEKIFTYQVWLTHIGTHTGEYQFECKKCELYQSPYSLNIANGAINHPCHVKKSDWRRLPMKWKEDDQVHVYVCKLCNYTQLNEDNVQQHLRVQHEASVNDNYTQVLFLRTDKRFPKYRTANKKKDADAIINDRSTNNGPVMPLLKNEVTPKKIKLNRIVKGAAGTTSPYQSDAFTACFKQDDGLFDDDTMRMMNDVSFSSATAPETPPRNASIADRLNERFKSAQKSEQEEEYVRNTSGQRGQWKVVLPRGLDDRPSATIDGPSADNTEQLQKEYDKLKEIDEFAIEFKSPEPECSSPVKTTPDKRLISEKHNDDGNDRKNGSVSNDSAIKEQLSSQETITNSITDEKPSQASVATDKSENYEENREDADNGLADDNNEEWESCSESDDASVASQTQPEIKKRHKKLSDTVNRLFNSISSRLPTRNRATKKTIKRPKVPEIKKENTEDNVDEKTDNKPVEVIPPPLAVNESTALSYAALVMEATDDLDESDPVGQNVASQEAVEHHGNGNVSSANSNDMRTSSTGGTVTTTTKTNSSALHYGIDGEDFSNGADSNGQSESMDQGSGKTINRIDNMGYSIWNNITEYCCMIENCCFETAILGKLLAHLEEHDINWGGYCFMCDRQVVDDVLPLMLEFKHMREFHLVKSEPSDNKPDPGHRPRIHVRRFSTDTLSVLAPPEQLPTPVHTDMMSSRIPQIISVNSLAPNATKTPMPSFLKISSVSGGGDIIPVSTAVSSATVQQPPKLMISKVVSMSKQIEMNDFSISINLKPWTKSPPQKYTWLCKKMLRDICLFALYKCMANECYFYTSDPDYMLYHLRNHDKQLEQSNGNNHSMDTTSWLQCSYCDETVDSCTLLVRHIHDEHSTSIFQCPYCFYRSCAAHNVVVHLQNYHTTCDAFVFVCNGKAKGLLMTQIAQWRDEHVRSLNCITSECNKVFFVIETFVRHLAASHADEFKCCFCKQFVPTVTAASHMQSHGIGLFECVYCLYGTNNVKNIQQHLCNEHPSKLLYVSVRLSRRDEDALQQNIPDSSIDKTVLSYIGQPVNKNMFHRCPYSAKQLNFMSPELTAIVNNMDSLSKPQTPPIGLKEAGLLKLDAIMESDVRNEANSCMLKNVVNIADLAKMHNIINYELYYRSLDSVVGVPPTPKPQFTPPAAITNQTELPLFVISNVLGGLANGAPPKSISPTLAPIPKPAKTTKTKDSVPSIETAVAPRTTQMQKEIDDAAYALVKGTGHEGTDLYRCGFPDCDGNGVDPIYFNVHLLKHTNPGENKNGFKCYHCDIISKNIVSLKYHIKVHGIHRYFCYYCDFTGPIMTNTLKHMLDTHKKSTVVTFPLNPDKTEQNQHMFVICPRGIRQDELNRFGLKLLERYKHKMSTTKKFYSGDEIDLLPLKSIFNELIACSLCEYSTKVRSNMQRHLTLHNEGKNVAKADSVNPVPCLDTGLKHFDKMKNLACSSNGSNETSPVSSNPYDPLAFVSETRRFLCNAKGCHYQTINEAMLRSHLITLHSNETDYKCPHCNCEINKGPMIVEKVLLHLRMHNSKIFRCPRCPFFHYSKLTVDKHIKEKHDACGEPAMVILRKVEGSANAVQSAVKTTDGLTQPKKYKWRCSLCQETFNMHKEVVNHVRQWHSITYQYECDVCNAVQSNSKQTIVDHLISKHPQDDKRVKYFYEKYESIESDETTPIWRRDDPNKVKHIRGILFEEEEAVKPQKKKGNGKARKRPTTSSLNAARMSEAAPLPKPLVIESPEQDDDWQKFEEIMLPEKKPAKLIQPLSIDNSVTVVISDEDSPTPSPFVPQSVALRRPVSPSTPKPEHKMQPQAIDDTNTSIPLSEEQFTALLRLPHTYVCRVCLSYSATTILKLRTHFSKHHPSSTFSVRTTSDFYMCSDADILAESTSADASTDIIKYVCHYCVMRFDKLNDTYKHWCLKHKSSDIAKPPAFPFRFRIMKQVRCYFCTLKGSLNDIKAHTFRRHAAEPLVTTDILDLNMCGQCDFKATWSHREIRTHYEEKHKAVGTAISNQVRSSDIEYLTQDFLDRLLSEGPKSTHICLLCSEEFNYKDEYEEHHDMAHGMRPQKFRFTTAAVVYNCSICRHVDHDEKELAKHIRGTHAMLYRCKHCDLEFMYLNQIEEHNLMVHQVKNKRYLCASVEKMRGMFENIQLTFPNGLILSKSELRQTAYGDVDSLIDHVRNMNEAELQLQRLRQEKSRQKSSIDKAKREISEARREMKEAEREKELAESHRRQTEGEETPITSSVVIESTKQNKEAALKMKFPAEPKKRARKRLASDVSSDATTSSRASKASMSSKGTRNESPAPSGAASKRKRQRKKRYAFYRDTDSDADLDADAVVRKMRKEMHKSGSSEDEPLAKLMPLEYSAYGQPVKQVDLSAISTYINFYGSEIKVTCDRLAALTNINPMLILMKVRPEDGPALLAASQKVKVENLENLEKHAVKSVSD